MATAAFVPPQVQSTLVQITLTDAETRSLRVALALSTGRSSEALDDLRRALNSLGYTYYSVGGPDCDRGR